MVKKYRAWVNLWHNEGGRRCVITKVFVKDGHRRTLDSFFRPSLSSAFRLSEIVSSCVMRGEGQLYPNVLGIGWSWQRRKR